MTVSTTTNKVSYIGNGVATSFAIPFPFLEKEHLKVRQLLNNVQTERSDWTLSGGSMVFATAPEEGAQIVIMREVPLTQETDYRENEILPAETLERNFDKLTLITQQLAEESNRSVKVSMFSNADPSILANEIEVLYGMRDKIIALVQNKADVNTVATNIFDVNTVAMNIIAIQNASTQAANALIWAEGNDTDVQVLGGTHSAKRWAELMDTDNYVDRTTNQEISGKKNFTSNLVIRTNNGSRLSLTDSGLTSNVVPVNARAVYVTQTSDDNKEMSRLVLWQEGEYGHAALYGQTYDTDGTLRQGILGVSCKRNGTDAFAYCPTPSSNSNDDKIATTAWVNNFFSSQNTKAVFAALSMPSNTLIALTAGASGSSYIMPKNGYLTLRVTPSSLTSVCSATLLDYDGGSSSTMESQTSYGTTSTGACVCRRKCNKGHEIRYYYTNGRFFI